MDLQDLKIDRNHYINSVSQISSTMEAYQATKYEMTAMNNYDTYLDNFGSPQTVKHNVDNSRIMLDYQVDLKEKHPLKLVFKKKFHCQHCDYFAENSDMYEIHQETHINRKLHQIGHGEICFTRKTNFVNHVKTSLVNHVKTDTTGEIVYQCIICDKCFYNKGSLVRHRGLHQGDNRSKQLPTCRRYRVLFNVVGGVIKTEDTCR